MGEEEAKRRRSMEVREQGAAADLIRSIVGEGREREGTGEDFSPSRENVVLFCVRFLERPFASGPIQELVAVGLIELGVQEKYNLNLYEII